MRTQMHGAELDLSLGVELSASIGELRAEVCRMREQIRDLTVDPVEFLGTWDQTTTVTVDGVACAWLYANLAVPVGYVWDVTRINVGAGISPVRATQAGTWYLFASNSNQDFTYAAWRDGTRLSTSTTPVPGFYSPGQFVVYGGQVITAIVASATAGVPLSFSGTALQRKGAGRRGVATVS